jgi:hypothetical protein
MWNNEETGEVWASNMCALCFDEHLFARILAPNFHNELEQFARATMCAVQKYPAIAILATFLSKASSVQCNRLVSSNTEIQSNVTSARR